MCGLFIPFDDFRVRARAARARFLGFFPPSRDLATGENGATGTPVTAGTLYVRSYFMLTSIYDR